MASLWLRQRKARLRSRPRAASQSSMDLFSNMPDLEEEQWSGLLGEMEQSVHTDASSLEVPRPGTAASPRPDGRPRHAPVFEYVSFSDDGPAESSISRSSSTSDASSAGKASWLRNPARRDSLATMGSRQSLLEFAEGLEDDRAARVNLARQASLTRPARVVVRRKSPCGPAVFDGYSMNPTSSGGILYDYIARSQRQPLHSFDTLAQQLNGLCQRDVQLIYDSKHPHQSSVAQLLSEALGRKILSLLTPELKCQGIWAKAGSRKLAEVAHKLTVNTRERRQLLREFQRTQAKSSQGQRRTREPTEPRAKFQKLEKDVNFWLDFHTRAWETSGEEINRQRMLGNRVRAGLSTVSSAPSLSSLDGIGDLGSSFTRTRLPPLTPPSTAGSISITRPSTRHSTRPSTSYERWWDTSGQLSPETPQTPQRASTAGSLAIGGWSPARSQARYLEACESAQLQPKALGLITGNSSKLNTRNLLDHDLLALTNALPSVLIDDVDLGGCTKLTDKSLVPFLEGLVRSRARKTLRRLVLHHCLRAAQGMQHVVVELLQVIDGLRILDLSSVQIGKTYQWPLCEAIKEHTYLQEVNLSNIGLGLTAGTQECMGALGMSKLRTLDLSWNRLSDKELACYADNLLDNEWLHSLNVSGCTAKADGQESPITSFLEPLGSAKTLQSLDISLTSLGPEAALVLEDALQHHKSLTHLNLSGNALGAQGLRSVLRLLSQGGCGLATLIVDGACHAPVGGASQTVLHPVDPSGRYELDLGRPSHRSFLRILYKWCDRLAVAPEQVFRDLNYSCGVYRHAAANPDRTRPVPTEGILEFTISSDPVVELAGRDVQDEDSHSFLRAHMAAARLVPAKRKLLPMLMFWKQLHGMEFVQDAFLQALSTDFNLTLAQLQALCEIAKAKTDSIISTLLPCVPDVRVSSFLSGLMIPNCRLFLATEPRTRQLVNLNLENPTGHHRLDLAISCERAAAQRLRLLDRWEVLLDLKSHRADISADGSRSHLRNQTIRGVPLHSVCNSPEDWHLPETDCLEFDYSSNFRPQAGVEAVSAPIFDNVLRALSESTVPLDSKLRVLSSASSHFHITSLQLRLLLGFFKRKSEQIEVFVKFFCRITDMWNLKVAMTHFFGVEEATKVRRRLGFAALFPFIQPESHRFELDLACHDQRICCSMLTTLACEEDAGNIYELRCDVPEDALPDGDQEGDLPRAWMSPEQVPKLGTVSGSYVCLPVDRRFDVRKALGQQYGFFKTPVPEERVLWWVGLGEPPVDVLRFVEFLMSTSDSPDQAFGLLDSQKKGQITIESLEETLETLSCAAFEGEDKQHRLVRIFDYLATQKENIITKHDWQTVRQLWAEYKQYASEFVRFLDRTFSSDLGEAWDALLRVCRDASAEGLRQQQFVNAVEEFGYFGPAAAVFRMLDPNGNTSLSPEQFMRVEAYRQTA